jgi:multisubunit Na+/H+ antiporter MnhF subunit
MSAEQEGLKDFEFHEAPITRQKLKSVDVFSIVLIAVVVIAVAFSVYFYRLAFGGELSMRADSWSAFGSFVGGVFGPLISFVTLVAILRTIRLQRELLLTQQHEFEVMQNIQNRTLASQLRQIKKSESEAAVRVFEEGRHNLLKMVDRYVQGTSKERETKSQKLDLLSQWIVEGKARGREGDVKSIVAHLRGVDDQIVKLLVLYEEIFFDEFESLDKMKDHFHEAIESIFSKDTDIKSVDHPQYE